MREPAPGPGRPDGGQSDGQRGRLPGRQGTGLRGALSGGGPRALQGEEGRQAPLFPQGPRRLPRGPERRIPPRQHHPPQRAAGEHGQRRGPAGAGGRPSGHLRQPQLLPHNRRRPRQAGAAHTPRAADTPGRPRRRGAGDTRGPAPGPPGGQHPPRLLQAGRQLAVVACPRH